MVRLSQFRKSSGLFFGEGKEVESIEQRSKAGGLIFVAREVINFILQVLTVAILAHILSPKDFGIVGVSLAPIVLMRTFTSSIFSTGIIQQDTLKIDDVNGFFWINISIGFFWTLLAFAISPLLSSFYNEKAVTGATRVLALQLIFSSISSTHTALLYRRMYFEVVALIDFSATLFSKVIAISFAVMGKSYWSLVAMNVSFDLIVAILSWFFCLWRPSFRFSYPKYLIRFGYRMSIISVISNIADQLEIALIGKYCGSFQLGLYERPRNMLSLPIRFLLWPLETVAISALSKLKENIDDFKKMFFAFSENLMFFLIPIYTLILVSAREIVLLFLGNQWVESISILQVLSLLFLITTILAPSSWFFISANKLKRYLYSAILTHLLQIIGLLLGLSAGVYGVAIGITLALLVYFPFGMSLVFHKTVLRFYDYLLVLISVLIPSFISGAVTLFTTKPIADLGVHNTLLMLIKSMCFFAVYVAVFLALPDGKTKLKAKLDYLQTVLKRKVNKGE